MVCRVSHHMSPTTTTMMMTTANSFTASFSCSFVFGRFPIPLLTRRLDAVLSVTDARRLFDMLCLQYRSLASKVTQFKKHDFRVITVNELRKRYPINHQQRTNLTL